MHIQKQQENLKMKTKHKNLLKSMWYIPSCLFQFPFLLAMDAQNNSRSKL